MIATWRFVIGEIILYKKRCIVGNAVGYSARQSITTVGIIGSALCVEFLFQSKGTVGVHAVEIAFAVTLLISYIVDVTVAFMRVSTAAAFKAIPPQPHIPKCRFCRNLRFAVRKENPRRRKNLRRLCPAKPRCVDSLRFHR